MEQKQLLTKQIETSAASKTKTETKGIVLPVICWPNKTEI